MGAVEHGAHLKGQLGPEDALADRVRGVWVDGERALSFHCEHRALASAGEQ